MSVESIQRGHYFQGKPWSAKDLQSLAILRFSLFSVLYLVLTKG